MRVKGFRDDGRCRFFFIDLQPLEMLLTTTYAPFALDKGPGSLTEIRHQHQTRDGFGVWGLEGTFSFITHQP